MNCSHARDSTLHHPNIINDPLHLSHLVTSLSTPRSGIAFAINISVVSENIIKRILSCKIGIEKNFNKKPVHCTSHRISALRPGPNTPPSAIHLCLTVCSFIAVYVEDGYIQSFFLIQMKRFHSSGECDVETTSKKILTVWPVIVWQILKASSVDSMLVRLFTLGNINNFAPESIVP